MFVPLEQFKAIATEYISEIDTCDSLRWECPSLKELLYMLCHYVYVHAQTQQEIKASVLKVFEQIGMKHELGADMEANVNKTKTTCPCTIQPFGLWITSHVKDVQTATWITSHVKDVQTATWVFSTLKRHFVLACPFQN
jgi:hypothetical protein